MAARSPARFLAPLALLAVVGALYLIVSPKSSDGGDAGAPAVTEQPAKKQSAKKSGASARKKKRPKTYTVQPGDTPSGIADQAGISLSKLEELNPSLDPQALAPGTKLKLR
jgi:LysM repeat protein